MAGKGDKEKSLEDVFEGLPGGLVGGGASGSGRELYEIEDDTYEDKPDFIGPLTKRGDLKRKRKKNQ
jgi:hypothetical protein